MGADNWDPCPRCVDQAQSSYDERVRSHQANYGIITAEEWIEEGNSLAAPKEIENTFREDYEWWVDDEDATLHGVFRGICTKCGLSVKHEVEPVQFYVREVKS